MKKLAIGGCALLVGFMSITFAQSITLELSQTQVDINDPFYLTIGIEGQLLPGTREVYIDGIEGNFDVLSQQSAENVKIINGNTTSVSQLQLQMRAKNPGEHIIGPAKTSYGTGVLISSTVTLMVTGEKMFVNGTPPQTAPTPGLSTSPSNPIDREIQDIIPEPVPLVQKPSLELPTRRWLILVGLVVILAGYLDIRRAKKKKEKIDEQHWGETSHPKHKNEHQQTALDLPSYTDPEFIKHADEYIRHYLTCFGEYDVWHMSYQEILETPLIWEHIDPSKHHIIKDAMTDLVKAKYSIQDTDLKALHKSLKSLYS